MMSKDNLNNAIVKEQRVYGSGCIISKSIMHLRHTLTDFERNYQVKPFLINFPVRKN